VHSNAVADRSNSYLVLSLIAAAQGKLSRVGPALAASTAATPANGRHAPLLDSLALAIVDISAANQPARALKRVDAALSATPFTAIPIADRDYLSVAIVYALAGRVDRAKAVLAQRATELRDTTLLRVQAPLLHRTLGEIAIAEGRPKDAVAEFWKGDSLPDGPYDECDVCTTINVARAYDKANMSDSAIVYFEKFFGSTNAVRSQVDFFARGPALRRLGELYETKGDRAKAAHYYQEFVNLWKDADPELQPQVTDVKKRLARMDSKSG
jgi:tetratricopeptide (TPR) repeat protein